jgi:hypothetical protein
LVASVVISPGCWPVSQAGPSRGQVTAAPGADRGRSAQRGGLTAEGRDRPRDKDNREQQDGAAHRRQADAAGSAGQGVREQARLR